MAALKAEWLAERRARQGAPVLARAVANLRRLLALAAPLAPLINAVARTQFARPAMRLVGAAPQRPVPAVARRPLTRRAAGDADPDVVLFADCFIQYQEPHVGEAMVRLLRAAGHRVAVADVGCCGRTMMSTGMLEQARKAAASALAGLHPHVRAGRAVVFVEPSCISMVCDDWKRLLPGDPRVDEVAAASCFGLQMVAEAAAAGRLRFRPGGTALLHPHCHERALFTSAATEAALRTVPGLQLEVLDAGCCGMSGVFGYEAEHYELSVAIANRELVPAVRAAGAATAVLATGTSCRTQISDLAGRPAAHPAVFLEQRLL
jgi:Fe-S oxidoreductase